MCTAASPVASVAAASRASTTVSPLGAASTTTHTNQARPVSWPDEQRADRAHGVRVDQGAGGPPAEQRGLPGRHLQALRGLEDDGAQDQRGQRPQREHQGAVTRSSRRRRRAARASLPTSRPSHAAVTSTKRPSGVELVEVGGDQPDDADADEAGAEEQQQPADREPAGGAVAAEEGSACAGSSRPSRVQLRELAAQPGQLARGRSPGRGTSSGEVRCPWSCRQCRRAACPGTWVRVLIRVRRGRRRGPRARHGMIPENVCTRPPRVLNMRLALVP